MVTSNDAADATTYGSVCSGIEAATVVMEPFGWRASWFAEIESFPSTVLAHHYPTVPNLGDMTKIAARVLAGEVDAPDVLVGGTPCQAFSIAGMRAGMADARGALTLSFVGLANAIDSVRAVRKQRPAVIWWENVFGVLSSKDNAFGCFLAGLAGDDEELIPEPQPAAGKSSRYWKWSKQEHHHIPSWPKSGCIVGPQRTVAWRTFDAQYFGVAQRRRRVFVVASAGDGFDPSEVLLEFEGVRRDSPPRREAGQSTTHPVAGCLTSSRLQRIGDPTGQDPVVAVASTGDISYCLNAGGMGRQDFETETLLVQSIAGALQANGKAAGSATQQDAENGMLVVAPIPFDTTTITNPNNGSNPQPGAACHTLAAQAHPPCIAFSSKDFGADATLDLSPTLRSGNHDKSHANGGQPPAIAFQERGRADGRSLEVNGDLAYALTAPAGGGRALERNVLTPGMVVRRLTPRECERLQAFHDDYTRIPMKKAKRRSALYDYIEIDGQLWQLAADGPRYKALGNSMCVYNMRWIGQRVDAVLRTLRTQEAS